VKPRLLDLFCGAGGAAQGYADAGYAVLGVDEAEQPRYPFGFVRADAMKLLGAYAAWGAPFTGFEVIHASPPCHDHSTLVARSGENGTGWLLRETLRLLDAIGLPYVVENVSGADMSNSITLCGSSFGLPVWRHRKFIVSPPLTLVPPCAHHLAPKPIDVTGTGSRRVGGREDGGGGNSRKPRNLAEARAALGIDWMTRRELSQAIPPAYTEWIGRHLPAWHDGETTE
jgi:DNA (cytosine-5)-methyltransferase 1